jgi:hypothetical protein
MSKKIPCATGSDGRVYHDFFEAFVRSLFGNPKRAYAIICEWMRTPLYECVMTDRPTTCVLRKKSNNGNSSSSSSGAAAAAAATPAAAATTAASASAATTTVACNIDGIRNWDFESHISHAYIDMEHPERALFRFLTDVLFGRADLALDGEGVYLMLRTNRALFVPLSYMNRREIGMYSYWSRNAQALFADYRSYRLYASLASGYVFSQGRLPVDVLQNILAAFHVYMCEFVSKHVWSRFWRADSVLNARRYDGLQRLPDVGQLLSERDYLAMQYVQHHFVIEFFELYTAELDILYNLCDGLRWHSLDAWHRCAIPEHVWRWVSAPECVADRCVVKWALAPLRTHARRCLQQAIASQCAISEAMERLLQQQQQQQQQAQPRQTHVPSK